jgi:hypothetical protein
MLGVRDEIKNKEEEKNCGCDDTYEDDAFLTLYNDFPFLSFSQEYQSRLKNFI